MASHALITLAIRSGEPYRLQIYEFMHSLLYGGGLGSEKVRGWWGTGGWGLGSRLLACLIIILSWFHLSVSDWRTPCEQWGGWERYGYGSAVGYRPHAEGDGRNVSGAGRNDQVRTSPPPAI